jgi:hypothetical protein
MSDDDEQFMMSEWLQYAIVLLITLISIAALGFFVGYLL